MFFVFTGDDRTRISQEVRKVLGETYEVFEGGDLSIQDLVNICQGMSLFSSKRKILIKDLSPLGKEKAEGENEVQDEAGIDYYSELKNYVNTPHEIVIWETKVPRKKSFKEFCKMPGVKERKFVLQNAANGKASFNIVNLIFSDPQKAVRELRKIEDETDPYSFVGLITAVLSTRYGSSMGAKEKRALLALSELDMQMKTTTVRPWTLVEAFILRFSLL